MFTICLSPRTSNACCCMYCTARYMQQRYNVVHNALGKVCTNLSCDSQHDQGFRTYMYTLSTPVSMKLSLYVCYKFVHCQNMAKDCKHNIYMHIHTCMYTCHSFKRIWPEFAKVRQQALDISKDPQPLYFNIFFIFRHLLYVFIQCSRQFVLLKPLAQDPNCLFSIWEQIVFYVLLWDKLCVCGTE